MKNLSFLIALFCLIFATASAQEAATSTTPEKDKYIKEKIEKDKKVKEATEKLKTATDKLKEERKKIQEAIDKKSKDHGPVVLPGLKKDSTDAQKELDDRLKKIKEDLEEEINEGATKKMEDEQPKTDKKEDWEEYKKKVLKRKWAMSKFKARDEEILRRIRQKIQELEAKDQVPAPQNNNQNQENGHRQNQQNHYYSSDFSENIFPKPVNSFWISVSCEQVLTPFENSFEIGPEQLDDAMQTLFGDPAIFGQIMERLGGEFFIEPGSRQSSLFNQNFEIGNRLGINLLYKIRNKFSVNLGLQTSQIKASADFPVQVRNFSSETMETKTGTISTAFSGGSLVLGASAHFGKGKVQFVAGPRFRLDYYGEASTKANLAGEEWEAGKMEGGVFAGYEMQAGILYQPLQKIQVGFATSIQKAGLPNQANYLSAGMQLSVGLKLF